MYLKYFVYDDNVNVLSSPCLHKGNNFCDLFPTLINASKGANVSFNSSHLLNE